MEEQEELVRRLVAVHGEEGLSPTAHSWREIFKLGKDGPIHLINLLKFRQQVDTPEGPISGVAAYGKYTAGVGPAFARVGGQRIYFGQVGHAPSADALAQMWLSPEFISAHTNRVDGVERSQVLVFGEPQARSAGTTASG